MRFRTVIEQTGENTTGIVVPPDVVDALGAGKRPPVVVTVGGYTYRSTIASMGGRYLISLSAERRAESGLAGGDEVEVLLEVDDAPREVEVPDDLAAALDGDPTARSAFDALSPSRKKAHVVSVTSAKAEETRARRVEKVLASLHN